MNEQYDSKEFRSILTKYYSKFKDVLSNKNLLMKHMSFILNNPNVSFWNVMFLLIQAGENTTMLYVNTKEYWQNLYFEANQSKQDLVDSSSQPLLFVYVPIITENGICEFLRKRTWADNGFENLTMSYMELSYNMHNPLRQFLTSIGGKGIQILVNHYNQVGEDDVDWAESVINDYYSIFSSVNDEDSYFDSQTHDAFRSALTLALKSTAIESELEHNELMFSDDMEVFENYFQWIEDGFSDEQITDSIAIECYSTLCRELNFFPTWLASKFEYLKAVEMRSQRNTYLKSGQNFSFETRKDAIRTLRKNGVRVEWEEYIRTGLQIEKEKGKRAR